MTVYQTELEIDFGKVGYWNSSGPFRIRLDANPLTNLISDADNAHRVVELLLIDRPGDVWDYVQVMPEDVSARVTHRIALAHQSALPMSEGEDPPPLQSVAFTEFDGLFYWAFDDTDPEDEAWLNHRNSATMRAFARQLLAMARAAQAQVEWNDHLLRHVASRVRAGDHAFSFLERKAAINRGRQHPPRTPTHTTAFYKTLDSLVRDPELTSIAYRADGDYRVLRILATEQRRRANGTGHTAGHAMHLSALVNNRIDNEAWDSEIRFFEEGLDHGDLFIEGGGLGDNLKALVEIHGRVPGRFILSTRNEGNIRGFDMESGDGWVVYRKQSPDSRRVGLERIDDRRHAIHGPVLKFEGTGATLFEHEKVLMLVGQSASPAVRGALASVVVQWQQRGGDPVLMVLGDTTPFDAASCRYMPCPIEQVGTFDTRSATQWLWSTLQRVRPWIDAVVALDAPAWATQVVANRAGNPEGLWQPWVVATRGVKHLTPHVTLEGDVAQLLAQAHGRANGMRPQRL